MASQELPKLLARVRFPSPAPLFLLMDPNARQGSQFIDLLRASTSRHLTRYGGGSIQPGNHEFRSFEFKELLN